MDIHGPINQRNRYRNCRYGTSTFIDSDFANTKDAVISGSATVDFVEGTVDATTVEVTGNGIFKRLGSLDVTVTADTNAVLVPTSF